MNREWPKRRFWQIHFSTLAILLIEWGLLVPMNLRGINWFFVPHFSGFVNIAYEHPPSNPLVCIMLDVIVIGITALALEQIIRKREVAEGSRYAVDEPHQRGFWQVHLATLIVITLACGLVLFLNCFPSPFHFLSAQDEHGTQIYYGWPYYF